MGVAMALRAVFRVKLLAASMRCAGGRSRPDGTQLQNGEHGQRGHQFRTPLPLNARESAAVSFSGIILSPDGPCSRNFKSCSLISLPPIGRAASVCKLTVRFSRRFSAARGLREVRTRLIGALSPHTVDAPRMKCSINSARWVRESRAVQLRRDVLRQVRAQPAAFCCEDNPEAKIRWVSLLDAFPKIPRPLRWVSVGWAFVPPRAGCKWVR